MEAPQLIRMLLLIISIGLEFVPQTSGDCSITKRTIESTNRIFTKRDASNNYELNRLSKVRTGEVLHMVCQENDIVPITCQINGIFDRKFPMDCPNPIAPTATIVEDASCSATMYSVGYTIHNSHLELYRACYDRTFVKALFTTHSVFQKSFFPPRNINYFTLDNAISPHDALSFHNGHICKAFKDTFGSQQRYIPNYKDTIINRGHLTPFADFLSMGQGKATFKYINVVPQFESINNGNWETIEQWVRRAISVGGSLKIKTGVKGILTLPYRKNRQKPVYLGEKDRSLNPMPEWLYKVVSSSSNEPLRVFVTYNNVFATSRPNAPTFCHTVECPGSIVLLNTAAAGYTFCCNTLTFNP